MNSDAEVLQPTNAPGRKAARDAKMSKTIHFNLKKDGNEQGDLKDILNDGATEGLWKMYNKAKRQLPYRERMENLTWRMMYINNGHQYRRVVNKRREPKNRRGSNEEPNSNCFSRVDSIKQNEAPLRNGFEYATHIKEITGTYNGENGTRKRTATVSPFITGITPTHPNSDKIGNELLESQLESESAYSFSLDSMAFEGPTSNFTESVQENESILNNPSFIPHGSDFSSSDIRNNGYSSSSLDNEYFTESHNTVGPSTILNGGSHNNRLDRNDNSLLSLNDYFRSQNNTPFTNQLNNRNMSSSNLLGSENSGQIPPYPLMQSNSFSDYRSPERRSLIASSSQHSSVNTPFDTADYSFSMTSSNFFDSYKNSYPTNSISFTNLDRNIPPNISSSLPQSWNESFSNEYKKSTKKIKPSKAKKNQIRLVSPEVNTPTARREETGSVSCTNCHTKATPLWRRDPQGQPLCNACGLFLKLHGVVRPLSLKTDVIKKRRRGSNSTKKPTLSSMDKDGDDLEPAPISKTLSKRSAASSSSPDHHRSPIKSSPSVVQSTETSIQTPDHVIQNERPNDSDLHTINYPNHDYDNLNTLPLDPNYSATHNDENSKHNWDWLGMAL